MGAVWILTGPLGSGKSTVGGLLAELGARHEDADRIVRRRLETDAELAAALAAAFGAGVLGRDGRPDRQAIAALAFGDAASRRRLEALLHPPVLAELGRLAAGWAGEAAPLVLEVVLWLQQEREPFPVDGVVMAWAPRARLLERAAARGGLSAAEAAARLDAQGDWEALRPRAQVNLDTDCPIEVLRERVRALYRSLARA